MITVTIKTTTTALNGTLKHSTIIRSGSDEGAVNRLAEREIAKFFGGLKGLHFHSVTNTQLQAALPDKGLAILIHTDAPVEWAIADPAVVVCEPYGEPYTEEDTDEEPLIRVVIVENTWHAASNDDLLGYMPENWLSIRKNCDFEAPEVKSRVMAMVAKFFGDEIYWQDENLFTPQDGEHFIKFISKGGKKFIQISIYYRDYDPTPDDDAPEGKWFVDWKPQSGLVTHDTPRLRGINHAINHRRPFSTTPAYSKPFQSWDDYNRKWFGSYLNEKKDHIRKAAVRAINRPNQLIEVTWVNGRAVRGATRGNGGNSGWWLYLHTHTDWEGDRMLFDIQRVTCIGDPNAKAEFIIRYIQGGGISPIVHRTHSKEDAMLFIKCWGRLDYEKIKMQGYNNSIPLGGRD